jgi:excisionase family DNA binding protein
MSDSTIAELELMELWRTSRPVMISLRNSGLLVPDSTGRGIWYKHSTINAYHKSRMAAAARAKGKTFPTLRALQQLQQRTGRPSLLTTTEVRHRTGLKQVAVLELIKAGRLLATQCVGKDCRIPEVALETYLRHRAGVGMVSAAAAAQIMGVRTEYVEALSRGPDPILVRVENDADPVTIFFDEAQFMEVLGEQLTGITAEEWRIMRESNEPLLSLRQAETTYHVALATLSELVESGEIPAFRLFAQTRAPKLRLPPHAIEAAVATRKRAYLQVRTVGRFLGVTTPEARRWVEQGVMCPPDHTHERPWQSCLVEYAKDHRTSDTFDGKIWWQLSIQRGQTPVDRDELIATTMNATPADVDEAISSGVLRAIRRPDDTLAIMRPDVDRFRERAARRLMGPDYHGEYT